MQRVLIIAFCLICAQIVSSLEDGFFDFHLMRYVPYSSKRSLFVENSHGESTNEWVLQLKEGTDPKEVARQVGLEYIDRVGDLSNMYLFRIPSNQIALDEQLILFHDKVELAERQFKVMPQKTVGYSVEPLWSNEWHLQNTGQNGGTVGADSKVQPVWLRNNMGQNSQIAIVDDGYETTHPDLSPGYVAADSYDFVDNDPDPNPALNTDGHGTCCAGVVGARDEGSCGVGAAFRARLAGIRLISSPVQYSTIASAVTYKNQNNWVYSNSWTFTACSNSTYCDLVALPSVIQNAFNSGVTNGRGGKGSIFIYAAGNARTSKSSMNYQAMQRSIYVIAVSAVTNYNAIAYYSEPGSGVHVAAPSNGGSLSIYTSDRSGSFGYSSGSCTPSFGGTSSACPLVAGIVGLMLTANPNLTWRDVQYILAKTATKANPNDPGWQKNGAGFNVSHDFGFGVVNADAAVSMAETYTNYLTCVNQYQSPTSTVNLPIPDNNPTGITSKMTISGVTVPSHIEHTLIGVTISHPNRGQLRIILKSPSGTQSILASPRGDPHADYAWVFKSNFNWGESPNGEWSLIVSDEVGGVTGTLIQWQLSFSGPCSSPEFRELENANLTVIQTTTQVVSTTSLPTTSVATTGTAIKSSPTISTTTSIPTNMAITESTNSIEETTQEMITSLPITNSQPSKETSDQILLPTNSDTFSEKSSSSRFGILGNSFFSLGWILVYVAAALLLTIIVLIVFFVIRRTTRPKFAESWYI